MGIYTNLIVGGFLHGIEIVIIHPLTIMMFSPRNDITYITTLHRIISVINHELIGFIHMTFVVAYRSRCFMMHHQFHTFTLSILIQHFHVKVRICSNKVEYIIFGVTEPVFPSFIPSFNQYLVKSMFGSKINVTFYILIVSTMLAVWLRF